MNGLEWIVRIAAGPIAACMLSARITHDQEQAELEKNLRR